MIKNRFWLGISLILLISLVGCASAPNDESTADTESEETVQSEPEPQPEPEAETEPEPEPVEETTPEVVEETEPEDGGGDLPEETDEPVEIEVSEELYEQTFTEVEKTIAELNEIISNRNFPAWQQYLTESYRRTYSDPEVLEQSSQSTVLVRNNIVLRDLEDYFTYVVVPSRSNARLDDLVFVDEDTVEAIMEVNERRYLLYLLKKSNDRWKIDTF